MMLSLLLGTCLSSVAAMASFDTVDELVDQNPDVLVLRKRLESSEALKGSLTRSFLPKLNLSYGRERFTTGPYHRVNQPFGGIEAELNLFNSDKDRIENSLRETQVEVTRIDVAILRAQVLAELKKALSHHAYLLEVRAVTTAALGQNEENLKSAQKRIGAGLASETDSLDFRQQKIQFKQELATLDYELGVTRRLVSTLMGLDPKDAALAEYTNAHPDHGQDIAPAPAASSLLLKRAQLQKEIAGLEYESHRRWWAPRLDLYGYAQRFTQKEREYDLIEERNDVTFGFKFSFPLFDGGEGLRGARAAESLVQARQLELRSQDLALQRQTLDASKKLELAHELIHGAEENVKVMNQYRTRVLAEYVKGVKNSPDVLQASQRWIEANIRYAEVKKNYQFARFEAEYLAGLR